MSHDTFITQPRFAYAGLAHQPHYLSLACHYQGHEALQLCQLLVSAYKPTQRPLPV